MICYALLCSAYEDIYLRVKSYDTLCWSAILSPFQSVQNQIILKPRFKVVNRCIYHSRLASSVVHKEV
jgi:hypothetical protein